MCSADDDGSVCVQVACDHLDTIADTVNFSKDDISELTQVARTTLSSKM